MKAVKVPVIMQMESTGCGAASLCMILAYYGKWVSLEQVREDSGVSRDGANAKNILIAARGYGLTAKGYKIESIEELKSITFPCIIHWNLTHYVVLRGFQGNKACINDPAKGSIKVSMDEFNNSFTGIVLMFTPGEQFEKGGAPQSILKFTRERLRGSLIPLVFIMITSFITALIGIINPVFGKVFIDHILSGKNPDWIDSMIHIMWGVVIILFIISTINHIYFLKIEGKMAISANSTFFWHLIRLPLGFFSQRYSGDIINRQSFNDTISHTLVSSLGPVLVNFVLLLLYLVVMVRYSLLLTSIAVLSCVANIFLYRMISAKRVNITRVQMSNTGKLSSITTSGIEMIETIKSAGAEEAYFERWSGVQAASNNENVKYLKLDQVFGVIPQLFQTLMSAAVLIIGTIMIMNGHFTIGSLLAFQGFLSAMIAPFSALAGMGQSLQEMRSSMERVQDVMAFKPDVNFPEPKEGSSQERKNKLKGNIELKNITFGYSKLIPPVIKDFSLKIAAGSKIAIVGASGCGKSTIAKLVSGLYQPWEGEILFDGKRRDEYSREVLTSSIGVVDQELIMFEDTVANNIKMWDSTIEDFEMILAARDAHIHDDIIRRNGGFNCRIHEGGRNFSGGQKQRIEIARVLAQEPNIVILDEATNALDAVTEHEVVKSINDRGITCIVVAHRLSTIKDCEHIIVIDGGLIVEEGSYQELMNKNGKFTELVTNE